MAEANKTVGQVLNELGVKLSDLIKQRDAEITRIDALPAAKKATDIKVTIPVPVVRGQAAYSQVAWDLFTYQQQMTKLAEFVKLGALDQKVVDAARKLIDEAKAKAKTGGAVNVEFAKYKQLTTDIRSTCRAMEEAALSRKPAHKVRTGSSGGSGNHVITKAWFEKHAKDCPKEMGVAWDDKLNRITYNLPKGGRGGTTSHGALNNILKAYKGVKPAAAPAAKPAPAAKTVPAKKAAPAKK